VSKLVCDVSSLVLGTTRDTVPMAIVSTVLWEFFLRRPDAKTIPAYFEIDLYLPYHKSYFLVNKIEQ
jgi:hypothetical protein